MGSHTPRLFFCNVVSEEVMGIPLLNCLSGFAAVVLFLVLLWRLDEVGVSTKNSRLIRDAKMSGRFVRGRLIHSVQCNVIKRGGKRVRRSKFGSLLLGISELLFRVPSFYSWGIYEYTIEDVVYHRCIRYRTAEVFCPVVQTFYFDSVVPSRVLLEFETGLRGRRLLWVFIFAVVSGLFGLILSRGLLLSLSVLVGEFFSSAFHVFG